MCLVIFERVYSSFIALHTSPITMHTAGAQVMFLNEDKSHL